jgi:hypothetical protein
LWYPVKKVAEVTGLNKHLVKAIDKKRKTGYEANGNEHLLWFRRLLDSHFEGINQKIKTLRRHGYGYPDDEYFFLKIIDMSPGSTSGISHHIELGIEP